MKRITFFALAFMFATFVCSNASWAQQKGSIELKATADKEIIVINDKGEKEKKIIKAEKVVPGDNVIYTIYCKNTSKEIAENVYVTNPIPEHMLYNVNTAFGAGTLITFSVNDGKTYDVPENITVIEEDGKERPAGPSDYTHIRWKFQKNLMPGEIGNVRYHAILK